MDSLRNAYLAEMGIAALVARERPGGAVLDGSRSSPVAEQDGAAAPHGRMDSRDVESLDWAALRAAVATCQRCELHKTRRQTVFGTGRQTADLLVIGEAPGADEDQQGEPFVGRAGQLLNAMLRAMGLQREDVYITNILKCRPPNNRDPRRDEATACSPFLDRQIRLLQPRAVLALGRISAQWLLGSELPVGKLRGQIRAFGAQDTSLVVSYHPAYLLRSPAAKAKAWQDLLLVKTLIDEPQ